jgi:hypothetical protein
MGKFARILLKTFVWLFISAPLRDGYGYRDTLP